MSKLITKNDLKTILDDVLPHDTVETITPSFTTDVSNPSATGTMVSAEAKIYGNVCHLLLVVKNASAISAGGNIYRGRISANVRPIHLANGSGYIGSSVATIQISADGELTVRMSGSVSANTNVYCSACYII